MNCQVTLVMNFIMRIDLLRQFADEKENQFCLIFNGLSSILFLPGA
jgi:hypothetical protein